MNASAAARGRPPPTGSAVPGDVADVDALVAGYGEEADEAASAEDVEFAQPALAVERSAHLDGVVSKGGRLGGQSLHLRDRSRRQPSRDVLGARVVVPGPVRHSPASAS